MGTSSVNTDLEMSGGSQGRPTPVTVRKTGNRLSRLLVSAATSLALTLAVAMPATVSVPGVAMADDPAHNQDNFGQYGSDRAYWRYKNQQQNTGRTYRRHRGDGYDRHRYRRDRNRGYYRDRDRGSNIGAGIAGAILGLGAGAILGQSLAQPRRVAPPVRYRGRPEPWTRAWYNYCSRKYRSFNPRTGYYTAYSGRKRFCR